MIGKRKTTEKFVEHARAVHGDIYDYSKAVYTGSRKKITIVCRKHGEFEQLVGDHLKGHGCPKCVGVKKLTTEEFIERVRIVHGDIYDYSKTVYTSSRKKITIVCRKHGEFEQAPYSHIRGQGCPKCVGVKKLTIEEFIEHARAVHGDIYDYSKVVYTGSRKKIIITCRKHGEFEQCANSHLQGQGCPKCSNYILTTTDRWIEKAINIHGNIYDYSKVIYTGAIQKITIICKKHGNFGQIANSHLQGSGCPKCRSSKGEIKIRNFLQEAGIEFEEQKCFKDCKLYKPLPFDFYIPHLNTLIEFDGIQHFKEEVNKSKIFKKAKNKWINPHQEMKDFVKDLYADEKQMRLIRIKYTENVYEKLGDLKWEHKEYIKKKYKKLFKCI